MSLHAEGIDDRAEGGALRVIDGTADRKDLRVLAARAELAERCRETGPGLPVEHPAGIGRGATVRAEAQFEVVGNAQAVADRFAAADT